MPTNAVTSPGTGFGALPIRPEDLARFAALTPDQKRAFLRDNAQRQLNGAPLASVEEFLKAGGAGIPNTSNANPTANGAPQNPAAPGASGSATVEPFLTAEDLFRHNDAWKSYQDQLSQLELELSGLETNTNFELGENDRNLVKGQSSAKDQAAGRGIYNSSIKDAELFDLEATRNMRRTFLQGQLSSAAARAARLKKNLDDWWTQFLSDENTKKVQNAAAVSSGGVV